MDKTAALRGISDLLEGNEEAINHHPPDTIAAYTVGRDLFIRAYIERAYSEAEMPAGLSVEEFDLVERYSLSAAFIAAWYHLHGESEKRDNAAHSAATIVSTVGLDSEDAFRRLLDLERLWRRTLNTMGIGPSGVSAEVKKKEEGIKMKTSVGFLDALFGEKVTLEMPLPTGGVKKVKVTRKWLEQMEREGKIQKVPSSSRLVSQIPCSKEPRV